MAPPGNQAETEKTNSQLRFCWFGARDAGVMPGVAKGGRKVEIEDRFVAKTTGQLPHG